MYFPTIDAASEGGYGANPGVSLAELGAGERMMDKALLNIISLAGEIRAGTTIAGTELDLGCHGSRISQLEEHRLL